MAPNFRINTKNFTYVDETSLMSHPNIIKFDSKNKIYYETLNKYFTNFEEELEIENHEQDDTSTSLATDLPLTKWSSLLYLCFLKLQKLDVLKDLSFRKFWYKIRKITTAQYIKCKKNHESFDYWMHGRDGTINYTFDIV